MTTPAQEKRNRRLVLALVLALLVATGAGVGFSLGLPGPANQAARNESAANQPAPLARVNAPVDAPANQPAPAPGPGEKPAADPLPRAELPVMTRFRRLVLEADTVLELADANTPLERLAGLDAILRGLDSRFAAYSGPLAAGKATETEWKQLQAEAARMFLKPDVHTPAYTMDAQPRVAIWLRQGAKLPVAETAPPGNDVPVLRRRQEPVSAEIAARWLEAIEAEFGPADFGREPHKLPLDIVIFPRPADYLEFSRKRMGFNAPAWSAGFYSSAWDVACAPLAEMACLAEVLRHEMFHAVQAHCAPQSLMAPWFGEGTAEWLDKAPPADGKPCTDKNFAQAAMGYLGQLVDQGYALNLREFLALDMAGFYQRPELNYLVAYCFVDFLRAEEDLRPVYFEFWKLMVGGAPLDNAFHRTFGVLDLAEVERRFLARIRSTPRQGTAPRFSYDGSPELFDKLPALLEGDTSMPAKGEVSPRWFGVLGKLAAKGIDVSRTPYLRPDFDRLVIAIDHTESMAQPFGEDFDHAAFGRWLYSMRYAAQLQLTRRTEDGAAEEEVPPQVLMALVEATLTGKAEAFSEATGVNAKPELLEDIRKQWNESEFAAENFARRGKRDMCRLTAESMAWVWGVKRERADVTVVDFHISVRSESARGKFEARGVAGTNPIQGLFAATAVANAPKEGMQGADTDWSLALGKLVEAASKGGKRVECLFFTDGPNSTGTWSHQETGRNHELYFRDQKLLAQDFNEAWQKAGLHGEGKTGTLQLFALPGAENQGLDAIPTACQQAKLDNWWPRFRK